MVSQSPAFIVCFANQFGMLHKLTEFIDRLKDIRLQRARHVFYAAMMAVALLLLADVGSYTFIGTYLF